MIASFICPTLALASEKTAAEDKMPEGFSGSIGFSIVSAPRYEGSKETQTRIHPIPDLNYKIGNLVLSTSGVRYTFADNENFTIGAILSGDGDRRDKKSSFVPGSDFLKGIGDVKATATLGVFGSVNAGIPFTFSVLKTPSGKGHGGLIADFGTSLPCPITDKWMAGVGVSAQYADEKYMQSYFGVTPLQAANTKFIAYKPKAGIKSVGLSFFSEYAFNKEWSLGANVALNQLQGDAAKSPIVQKKNGVSSSLSVSYKF